MMDNGMMNSYEYTDGYMEQEEEWEREGLLDPAWEKQQKKVSSTWHTLHLLTNWFLKVGKPKVLQFYWKPVNIKLLGKPYHRPATKWLMFLYLQFYLSVNQYCRTVLVVHNQNTLLWATTSDLLPVLIWQR